MAVASEPKDIHEAIRYRKGDDPIITFPTVCITNVPYPSPFRIAFLFIFLQHLACYVTRPGDGHQGDILSCGVWENEQGAQGFPWVLHSASHPYVTRMHGHIDKTIAQSYIKLLLLFPSLARWCRGHLKKKTALSERKQLFHPIGISKNTVGLRAKLSFPKFKCLRFLRKVRFNNICPLFRWWETTVPWGGVNFLLTLFFSDNVAR